MERLKKIPVSLVRYVIVGGVSLIADYGSLLLMYRVFGIDLPVATLISFLFGLSVNFILNKQWSFGAASNVQETTRQVLLYLLLVAFNTFFTVYAVLALNNAGMPPEISKPLCVAVITLWNYLLYKRVIFRQS